MVVEHIAANQHEVGLTLGRLDSQVVQGYESSLADAFADRLVEARDSETQMEIGRVDKADHMGSSNKGVWNGAVLGESSVERTGRVRSIFTGTTNACQDPNSNLSAGFLESARGRLYSP
jgi:hypothetical protein